MLNMSVRYLKMLHWKRLVSLVLGIVVLEQEEQILSRRFLMKWILLMVEWAIVTCI